jgi:hypothetical protein
MARRIVGVIFLVSFVGLVTHSFMRAAPTPKHRPDREIDEIGVIMSTSGDIVDGKYIYKIRFKHPIPTTTYEFDDKSKIYWGGTGELTPQEFFKHAAINGVFDHKVRLKAKGKKILSLRLVGNVERIPIMPRIE